jgi:hypothetical protein
MIDPESVGEQLEAIIRKREPYFRWLKKVEIIEETDSEIKYECTYSEGLPGFKETETMIISLPK